MEYLKTPRQHDCRQRRGIGTWFPTLLVVLAFARTSRHHYYSDTSRNRSIRTRGQPHSTSYEKTKNDFVLIGGAYAFLPPVVIRRGIGVSANPKTSVTGTTTTPTNGDFDGNRQRWHRSSHQQRYTGPIYQTTINNDELFSINDDVDDNQNGNINNSSNNNRNRNINSVNMNQNDTYVGINGRSLLSPNHLLYPETFRKFDAPLNHSVPLFDALRLIKQSLAIFVSEDYNPSSPLPSWALASSLSSQFNVLRIEQKISHHADPLCWLQAQIENNAPLSSYSAAAASTGHPAFYIATAEGTVEAAVFGSSRTHRGSLDEDETWWEKLVPGLPDRARVYGGQRFDSETEPSDEWKSFSRGFWMLPAVELRREKTIIQRSTSSSEEEKTTSTTFTTTLAVHLVADHDKGGFISSARHIISIIEGLTDTSTPAIPPTTLPPILSRSSTYQRRVRPRLLSSTNARTLETESTTSSQDGQEVYESGVEAALLEFARTKQEQKKSFFNNTDNNNNSNSNSNSNTTNDNDELGEDDTALLEKVVLARRLDLQFDQSTKDNVRALDILRKWKFASQPGGHLIYLCPDINGDYEFFGCTPERLFQVVSSSPLSNGEYSSEKTTRVVSEALAGTRPRGSTPQADQELSRQLFASAKDQSENKITGRFITEAFDELIERGWINTSNNKIQEYDGNDILGENHIKNDDTVEGVGTMKGRYFVRRLRHLQHICQQFQCQLSSSAVVKDVIRHLLTALHPTPAVGGYPKDPALDFIRQHESIGFDRGYYSGPIGFIGREEAEIVVAIRSGLISRGSQPWNRFDLPSTNMECSSTRPSVYVYAGAGIVPGSTAQGEWSETSSKLAVVSSIFPQSPFTLQSAMNPNSAWSTAFVEELVRNGITQFYICPGSRSTPLVAAIAKVVRSNIGVVNAMSVLDERGAGFRALGYGRGSGRPAAVITSSGTAVANLYPAIIEAGMDAVPLLVVTADRPYENRNTGANQAIDQVKIFSESYVRWFRDILPPHDDVPISVALADAAFGVNLSRRSLGPVHLNVQFRENLAPDAGPIRNDNRVDSITKFDSLRFTDAAGFQKWSLGGNRWLKSSSARGNLDSITLMETIRQISESKRGIIVVGNIRKPTRDNQDSGLSRTVQLISNFALSIGYPIFAGVQSGNLRFESSAVVPFAEHLLRCPLVQNNLKPDLIIQLGAPLISTEIPKIIKQTLLEEPLSHVLVHPHHPQERYNPDYTLSHIIDSDIDSFLIEAMEVLENQRNILLGSQLAPVVNLGRMLQEEMPTIVEKAVENMKAEDPDFHELTEPEVVMKLSHIFTNETFHDSSLFNLFLSNSMPVRDSEAFLYPTSSERKSSMADIGINRGASGIDGIISSAAGFADSTGWPTLLLIGDVAALHDINALHALRTSQSAKDNQSKKNNPLTTIVLNNDGGGIFSFLPIAKHKEVGFEEFFGTPTNTFSFEKAAEAFDISFSRVKSLVSFKDECLKAGSSEDPSIIEVMVAPREKNVVIHSTISALVNKFISRIITPDSSVANESELLPLQHSRAGVVDEARSTDLGTKTLVLLHGWMGDKTEWKAVESNLIQSLPNEWSIFNVDLPGHGSSKLRGSSRVTSIQDALGLVDESDSHSSKGLGLDDIALAVCQTLKSHGVERIDALAGYSLGGRVALTMKRLSMIQSEKDNAADANIVNDETKMILVSTYPGEVVGTRAQLGDDLEYTNIERLLKDERWASEIENLANRGSLRSTSPEEAAVIWSDLLSRWYGAPLWGALRMQEYAYGDMIERRIETLSTRGQDIAAVLRQCSPPRCSNEDWRGVNADNALYIVGERDRKYCTLGRQWSDIEPSLGYIEVPGKGHALLVEAAEEIAMAMNAFLSKQNDEVHPFIQSNTKIWETSFIPSIEKTNLSSRIQQTEAPSMISIGSLDFESFSINLFDEGTENQGVLGVGWGLQAKANGAVGLKQRLGFVVQVTSKDGLQVGIGEVSPLVGLHMESFEEAGYQVEYIANKLSRIDSEALPSFDAAQILALDGALEDCISSFSSVLEVDRLLPSVRSGLEMAILSLSSSKLRTPIHQALVLNAPNAHSVSSQISTLPLNGLTTRSRESPPTSFGVYDEKKMYSSWKVKIGHQPLSVDIQALRSTLLNIDRDTGMIRADANRGFNQSSYAKFAKAVKTMENVSINVRLEYIEEPLEIQIEEGAPWSLEKQVAALERSFNENFIPYALDESVHDLLEIHLNDFSAVAANLLGVFGESSRGCAAIILKPSLLGLEMSLRVARFARAELGIGAVFTSSFDSGIGLAYASFLGTVSDASPNKIGASRYPHGLSTFDIMSSDSISPSFGSYVSQKGILNVASLSRAFFGLGLDEIQSVSSATLSPSLPAPEESTTTVDLPALESSAAPSNANGTNLFMLDEFEASTSASSTGRDIVLVASLPLPFNADIACARFTDLPQQPRWSPWLASVAYTDNGKETEWTLRVRGVSFRWRAESELVDSPYKGIRWESTSGVKNKGIVEFVPTPGNKNSNGSCSMKVRMAFVAPRLLSSLFRGTVVEDFLRNKIMKWSLEMFRDVVKGDLALEEGNLELGDALFGAVEGKASAIEATLASSRSSSTKGQDYT
ncbi:MAG: 2-succinyl-5-enolpyruvyl-6-hydroxy-3-cyclohexene-1-carboxylate synthase [Bacillariaceae sp.]|jgi:2-succinyl-5-enolpyruvyl-6-hydroxy-3-cyclohexene-1-carboxylate synthase